MAENVYEREIFDLERKSIRDNGNGLPKNFNPKESDSLGLKLVDMLTEQLPGNYDFNSGEYGTEFNLLFKVD
ncbi:hypothetical protein [Gracilimonas sp.]|uniref:hypothetical protein n=1 Tax=Gracilimonas sp. TaxID=1974203 RepID=UPI003751AE3F